MVLRWHYVLRGRFPQPLISPSLILALAFAVWSQILPARSFAKKTRLPSFAHPAVDEQETAQQSCDTFIHNLIGDTGGGNAKPYHYISTFPISSGTSGSLDIKAWSGKGPTRYSSEGLFFELPALSLNHHVRIIGGSIAGNNNDPNGQYGLIAYFPVAYPNRKFLTSPKDTYTFNSGFLTGHKYSEDSALNSAVNPVTSPVHALLPQVSVQQQVNFQSGGGKPRSYSRDNHNDNRSAKVGCDSNRCRVGWVWTDLAGGGGWGSGI